jgi:hypothetical protein
MGRGRGRGMLGRRNIRDSIGYVTLGLFSHALLDELLEAKRRPEAPPAKRKMITIAIESLKAVRSPKDVDPSLWRDLVFQNYQEARTLFGAIDAHRGVDSPDELENMLAEILRAEATEIERLHDIDRAIAFFGELARMAVINAECPEERVPPGVRQLVAGVGSR